MKEQCLSVIICGGIKCSDDIISYASGEKQKARRLTELQVPGTNSLHKHLITRVLCSFAGRRINTIIFSFGNSKEINIQRKHDDCDNQCKEISKHDAIAHHIKDRNMIGIKEEDGIDKDNHNSKFRRTKDAIRDFEIPQENAVDIGKDAQEIVPDDKDKNQMKGEIRGQSSTHCDNELSKRIGIMIDKETKEVSLNVPDPCNRAIEAVAKPVDNESERSKPKKSGMIIGEKITQTGDNSAQDTNKC